jgi:hypothetical protein
MESGLIDSRIIESRVREQIRTLDLDPVLDSAQIATGWSTGINRKWLP